MGDSIFRNVKDAIDKYGQHTNFRTQELHAFGNGDENKLMEYYKRISAIHHIDNVAVPCLCLDSVDDPFYFFHDLKSIVNRNQMLSFIFTSHGGHIGWVEKLWGKKYYITVLKKWICDN